MYPPEVIARIRKLLEDGMTEREAARWACVSRGFVHSVKHPKPPRVRKPVKLTAYEQWLNAPVARCPTCGAAVRLPCLRCALRMGRSHPAIRRAVRLGIETPEGLMHRHESPSLNQNDEKHRFD